MARGAEALPATVPGGVTASAGTTGQHPATGQTGGVGFDATRQHRRRRSDAWIVAAAVAVCVLLVLWALLG